MDDIYKTYARVGNDRYIILWTPATSGEAMRTLGRWASNPDLSFTWLDATKCSENIKQQLQPQFNR
jgi:hypothetical protein